ncbi:family 43 glycosylhydrolase [Bifidobacterium simiiventris]|uniref:family 43 glycosylhydrolase n=1 Tax=Bifidobacterium simiiventris TaxID=2834434 RepID=UPI001C5889FE|nr:family 43 glycosylhydrolase [Bifidobacterium simiiventris]MBW3079201.1 family 43 glycosylhydrolase [Bifidobacterium simiiventris]
MPTRFGSFLPTDTAGSVAQLHGIGVQRFGDTWCAYGENKANGNLFQGVCCYTTQDFVHWMSHGIVFEVQEDGSALAADRIGERPKVLHCPTTGKYVMYIHAETPDYMYAHIGVAVADNPLGPFTFQTTITWRGYLSRDIGVFQDDDGSGYIMSEDRDHGTHIYRLSDDYLTIVEDVACERANDYPYGLESPTIVKKDGLYYWFGSKLTGWFTNDNMYSTAPDLHGPWSEWRTFAPLGTQTFDSQVDIVIPLDDDQYHSDRFLFIGDRWYKNDLGNSPIVQLPITIADGTASMVWDESYEGSTHREVPDDHEPITDPNAYISAQDMDD